MNDKSKKKTLSDMISMLRHSGCRLRGALSVLSVVVVGLVFFFDDVFDLPMQIIAVFTAVTAIFSFCYKWATRESNTKYSRVDEALIIALWGFGTAAVLFDGRVLHLEVYFQTITAVAVMYVLLVAFRIERLVRRTGEEEELTMDMVNRILASREILWKPVSDAISTLREDEERRLGYSKFQFSDFDENDRFIENQDERNVFLREQLRSEIKKAYESGEKRDLFYELFNPDHSKILEVTPEEYKPPLYVYDPPWDADDVNPWDADDVNDGWSLSKDSAIAILTCDEHLLAEKQKEIVDIMDSEVGLEIFNYAKRMVKILDEIMEKIIDLNSVDEITELYDNERHRLPRHDNISRCDNDKFQEYVENATKEIKDLRHHIEKFIVSKQHAQGSGEKIAIGILGGVFIALMQLGFPEGVVGAGALAVNLFSILTSTIVVFLFCTILDLERDRQAPIYERGYTYNYDTYEFDSRIIIRKPPHPKWQKWILGICLLMVAVYTVLLWDKQVNLLAFLH